MEKISEKILVVEAGRTERQYFSDLWRFRDLFMLLAWRDILVRYKQTVIGVAWSVLRPVLTMAIFTVVFGRLAKLPSDGIPYSVFVFAAMVPWQFFSHAVSEGSESLIANANMISKVYFPRLIVPTSSVLTCFVDFAISFCLLLGLMVWHGIPLSFRVLAIPGFLLLAVLGSLGTGYLLAALNVKFRDFRYVVPFVIQVGLYISPVGFDSRLVPDRWHLPYSLNPMVGIIDGFRWSLFGKRPPDTAGLAIGAAVCLVLFVGGLAYFRKTEKIFADVI